MGDSDHAFNVKVFKILLLVAPVSLLLLNFTIELDCEQNWEKYGDASLEMCFYQKKLNPNDTLFMKLLWRYSGIDT
jgi:hypothetical protein